MNPQGPVGAADKAILLESLAIMLVIVVPTILVILLFAWWFRASNRHARYRPTFVYSGRVELVTWSIPILVILFLGGVTWVGSHDLDPARPLKSTTAPLNVDVVSLDWKWLFIYPDIGIASVNELVVPSGTPIHLKLTSASVLNTFFVPQLGSMIYTMNGMADDLYLQADRPGVFAGRSAHFSGDGFSDMAFEVKSVPRARFSAGRIRCAGRVRRSTRPATRPSPGRARRRRRSRTGPCLRISSSTSSNNGSPRPQVPTPNRRRRQPSPVRGRKDARQA
jgi:cytochrome o ubiquinol oxidase subunit 2